ncbi:COP23 domain-containing protein [Lyngbya confervoides]|uniref:COP23 domain-containing protein n=1 Tax=Lyngbya confervoides BDU141951 TaxID=1574623 RepID=A0ABD4SYV1_9CYAN|nr:COP23 domain-containing protein [Lyngbya confervoides]MCM1981543.1 COP23 domain-containing protein [Lyngbya confervoides BDU141951]
MLTSKAINTKPAVMAVATAIAGLSVPLTGLSREAQLLANPATAPGETMGASEGKTAVVQETLLDPKQLHFYCKEVQDPTSPGNKIVSTVVWVPERQGNVRLVGWKSEYFSSAGFDPAKRCEAVSPKFQQAYEQGRLLLTAGHLGGYPVVCGVKDKSESCNRENQLFTLKPHDRPMEVLLRLADILEGKSSDMLLQNSGGDRFIEIKKWLKKGPIVDRDAPRTVTGGTHFAPSNAPLPPNAGGG